MIYLCKLKCKIYTEEQLQPFTAYYQYAYPLPFLSQDLISSPYCLPYNSYDVSLENLVMHQLMIYWYFSLFSSLDCMKLCWNCKEKFCLGHSWELKGLFCHLNIPIDAEKDNFFNNQEFLSIVIISLILLTLMLESGVIL